MTRLTEKCRPQVEMTDVFLYPCKSAPEINVKVHIGDSISISTIERCLTEACLKCPPPQKNPIETRLKHVPSLTIDTQDDLS